MSEALQTLARSVAGEALIAEVRAGHLADRLADHGLFSSVKPGWADPLRVGAVASSAALLGGGEIEALISPRGADGLVAEAEEAVRRWQAALVASERARRPPDLDDLVLYAATALLARRPVELRGALRQPGVRAALDAAGKPDAPWNEQVRAQISAALLRVAAQEHHEDLRAALVAIDRLAALQRDHDRRWAAEAAQRDLLGALGLYHLAHAVTRLAEFLLSGSVLTNGRPVRDFAAELRRLLLKAEEYLGLAGDPEVLLWLSAVAIILWRLRADSIWVGTAAISDRVDQLVSALAGAAREKPIFTLLPSQHEALRSRLLDPTQIAVVLQMPTSAGKTLLAELAIAQVFGAYRDRVRVAYVCPTRALATQVRRTLSEDLGPLGVQVSAAGAAFEEDPYEIHLLTEADGVVVATPEKLDLLVRAHPEWADGLRLVVVDEAHLLADAERGARLELLLANLRREQPQARLLLLTPFVQNARGIAEWLGDERGTPIEVHWRPSRLLLGVAEIKGRGKQKRCTIPWIEPYGGPAPQPPLAFPVDGAAGSSTTDRVTSLRRHLAPLGTVLGMFATSRVLAEEAATQAATDARPLTELTPGLRVAIAAAEYDYGDDCALARCLRHGVAFHHSALSPLLRYLIEDQVRAGTLRFVAATTTLAQGMNFPVAVVLVHSVQKPYGGGRLTPSEFWNIAGRAGRVGLAEEGLVVFASPDHAADLEHYRVALNEPVLSALLEAVRGELPVDLKEAYNKAPALRPFLQFLAHAVSTQGYRAALASLEELVQSSLAARQVRDRTDAERLRALARQYLGLLASKPSGLLKAADESGLGHFSFDALFAAVGDDPVLRAGPGEVLRQGAEGMHRLVEALRWLPELKLAIGRGEGPMDAAAVARVAAGWMSGAPVHALAREFPGEDPAEQIRRAGRYVYSTVSQTLSWGAHAYARSWGLRATRELPAPERMLPAYLQFGVRTPEAAVASLLGVQRPLAEAVGQVWREDRGALTPENAGKLQKMVEGADEVWWGRVLGRSVCLGRMTPQDVAKVIPINRPD